jgi:hypothetical protein
MSRIPDFSGTIFLMKKVTRRDFLKLAALGAGGLAFTPFNPPITEFDDSEVVRVATKSVSVYSEASDKSQIVSTWYRDELVNIYGEVTVEEPVYNPIWYRVWGGYMHRAHLQKVKILYNQPATSVRETGQLGEITVPYTQAYRLLGDKFGDQLVYRLYYQSVHWVVGIDEGPDGEPWYRLFDELLEVTYNVPVLHVRLIPDEEWAPLSPEIPFEKKRIEVSIENQQLTAYEYDQIVFQTNVSTGLLYGPTTNGVPTKTPKGNFHVQVKMPSKHMGDGNLAADIEAYELPGVPWDTFFTEKGHALHGAYWHDNFGTPMSHGCINMRPDEAKWLFRWTRPAAGAPDIDPRTQDKKGYGTLVKVY